MAEEVPHAVWSGSFKLFGVEVKCHTLSNGQRIIEKDSFDALMLAMADGGEVIEHDVKEFTRWQHGKDKPSP